MVTIKKFFFWEILKIEMILSINLVFFFWNEIFKKHYFNRKKFH